MPTFDIGSYTEQQELLNEDQKQDDLFPRVDKTVTRNRAYIALLWCIIVLQTIGIAAILLFVRHKWQGNYNSIHLYSPAEEAVEYQVKVFNFGIGDDLSPFQQPPSPELDRMWENLYNFGISRVPREQAAKLVNKTVPIPGDPDGYYITELDVFHQLHCLNTVRKALYPDYYPKIVNWDVHIGHCIDSIRQSLMCSADISTIAWQWDEVHNKSNFTGAVAHTCKNFEKLQDWAKEREILGHFEDKIRVNDDLRIPLYREDGSSYWP